MVFLGDHHGFYPPGWSPQRGDLGFQEEPRVRRRGGRDTEGIFLVFFYFFVS